MKKYVLLPLIFASQIAIADLNETESDYWQVAGLAHYVRSKEDSDFVAQFVRMGNNPSIVAFHDISRSCYGDGGKRKKVKILYQWVNYTQHCWGGSEYWIPTSQSGIDFVAQKFMSNFDVIATFDGSNFTFSTKNIVSVKQRWENTSSTAGNAL